jgi:hypothetical protein
MIDALKKLPPTLQNDSVTLMQLASPVVKKYKHQYVVAEALAPFHKSAKPQTVIHDTKKRRSRRRKKVVFRQ